MKTVRFNSNERIPKDFTGIAQYNNVKEWYLNGKRHRVDGPASEWTSGRKEWWVNGKRHREDGPAIKWTDGTLSWYLDDVYMASDENLFLLEGNYIVVERGIPTNHRFGDIKLTHAKLLTAEGTMFVPDNLPGMENFIKND